MTHLPEGPLVVVVYVYIEWHPSAVFFPRGRSAVLLPFLPFLLLTLTLQSIVQLSTMKIGMDNEHELVQGLTVKS